MTAKYEGHESHRPSYCWITSQLNKKLLSRNWDMKMQFDLEQTFQTYVVSTITYRSLFSAFMTNNVIFHLKAALRRFISVVWLLLHLTLQSQKIIISHPSLMHTFIPSANFIKFEYLHSKAHACMADLAVSSNNKTWLKLQQYQGGLIKSHFLLSCFALCFAKCCSLGRL